MSQEVAAVTAAKYVNEVTVGGVTRYQACVHGCSSEVRDTHHEAVKDARRMLQSATVTAVMKGYMPKLPAAAADAMNGASPPIASAVAREPADVAEATTEVLQATNRRVVALERDLAEVTAERDAARAAKSSEEAARVAVEMLESQVATLTKERDEDRKALAEAEECNRIGSERILKVVNERDELNKECDRWMARAERLAGIGRRLNQEKNDLEAERDAFALALARLVSKT